jgi:hypothetical protein
MIYEEVRELLLTQWTYTGGPNEAKAADYYHADPFPAPDWRRPWADEGPAEERQSDLPAHVAAGN